MLIMVHLYLYIQIYNSIYNYKPEKQFMVSIRLKCKLDSEGIQYRLHNIESLTAVSVHFVQVH